MSPVEALRAYALAGLPVGLVLGLCLGLVARSEGGWGGYGSFRRRAARLGHIAAVMVPAIAGLYALLLAGTTASSTFAWAAVLWVGGGIALCAALFVVAWRPRLVLLLPLPALALTAAAVLFARVALCP